MARRKRKRLKVSRRRRGRRLRRNPPGGAPFPAGAAWGAQPDVVGAMNRGKAQGASLREASKKLKKPRKSRKGKGKAKRGKNGRFLKTTKRVKRRRLVKRLRRRAQTWRKRAQRFPKRSVRRSVALTQAKRLSTLARVARRGKVAKSPVYRAMHVKSNPGLAGLKIAAKTLLPQIGVGAVAMVGCAYGGQKLAKALTTDGNGAPRAWTQGTGVGAKVAPYAPPLSTAGVTVVAYLVADKAAAKYKGAVAFGGLLAAFTQALIIAASKGAPDGIAAKAKSALGLGEYTLIGDAYSTSRPRPGRDNGMEWGLGAVDARALRPRGGERDNVTHLVDGLDDATEWAPGEGGVLSGGMFQRRR